MPDLTLYSTDHCSLCDALLDALLSTPQAGGFRLQVHDITADGELFDQYALRVPVLISDGREYTGTADPALLGAWLESL